MTSVHAVPDDPDFHADSAVSAAVRRELARPATSDGLWLVFSRSAVAGRRLAGYEATHA
jgi:hypothetical protein